MKCLVVFSRCSPYETTTIVTLQTDTEFTTDKNPIVIIVIFVALIDILSLTLGIILTFKKKFYLKKISLILITEKKKS